MKFEPLSKTLVLKVLLTSSVITTFMTIVSFYLDYRNEVSALDENLAQVKKVSVPSAAFALWNVDYINVETITKGIRNLNAVLDVVVLDDEGVVRGQALSTDGTDKYTFQIEYKLTDPTTGNYMGLMKIKATKKYIYQRLVWRAALFFITQGLKTLLVSFVLLYIFRTDVTNHITHMMNTIKDKSLRGRPLRLNKTGDVKNELDFLVDTYNHLMEKVLENERENVLELERHRAMAINYSRLASQGEMSTGIANEINNPLAIIQGSAHRALNTLDSDLEAQKTYSQIDRIISTSQRITDIIQGLRHFSRDAAGDEIKYESLRDIISATTSLCEEHLRNINCEFTVGEVPDILVRCRKTEMLQVLINILNNAYEATKSQKPRWVRLEFQHDDNLLKVRVVDSGEGVDMAIRERIFDPFYTTKDVGQGSGLGLSVSKSILQFYNGDVQLEDNAENTTFVVLLECKEDTGKNHAA